MPAFDNSLAEYLTPGLGEEAENAISLPKTLDYRRNDENYEHEMNVLNDEQNPSTNYKPTETLQFTRNLGVKYGFIKGEAIRLLRTNSSKNTSEEGLLLKKFFYKTSDHFLQKRENPLKTCLWE